MEKEPVKTVIAYTLSYQEDSDSAIIDLVIRSLDDGWVVTLHLFHIVVIVSISRATPSP